MKKLKATKTETRRLKCLLTEPELQESSKQCAFNLQKVEQLHEEKKQVMKDFGFRIQECTSIVKKCSDNINNGFDYRDVDCEVELAVPKPNKKTITRRDTGEVIIEDMSEGDYQTDMGLVE